MAKVQITIEAVDDSQATLEGVGAEIEKLAKKGSAATQSLDQLSRSGRGLTSAMGSAMGMMTQLQLVEITVSHASDRVRVAQERYTRALKEFGPGTEEAVTAQRELASATDALDKAQIRAKGSAVLIGLQVGSMVLQLPAAIRSVAALAATLRAAAVSGGLMNITLTSGVAALGIVAGIALFTLAVNKMTSATEDGAVANQDYAKSFKTVDAEAARAADTFQRLQGTAIAQLQAGLGRVGVSLDRLTLAGQRALLGSMGLSTAIVDLKENEDRLAAQAGRTTQAFQDQLSMTAKKDETMEQFIQRAVDVGATEHTLRTRVDMATRSLLSQEEAQRRLADATQRTQRVISETFQVPLGTVSREGMVEEGGARQAPLGYTGPIPAPTPSTVPGALTAAPAIVADIMEAAKEVTRIQDLQPPPAAPAAPGPTEPVRFGTRESYITPLRALETAARVIGTPVANKLREFFGNEDPRKWFKWKAHGFDGIVDRPTVMGFGEAGPERVTATPGRGHGGSNGGMDRAADKHLDAAGRLALAADELVRAARIIQAASQDPLRRADAYRRD